MPADGALIVIPRKQPREAAVERIENAAQRDQPEDDGQRDDHHGEDRTPDAEVGKAHRPASRSGKGGVLAPSVADDEVARRLAAYDLVALAGGLVSALAAGCVLPLVAVMTGCVLIAFVSALVAVASGADDLDEMR